MSVLRAKRDFSNALRKGEEVICPVCDRRSHIDGRPFDLTLARALHFLKQWDAKHPRKFLKMAPALNEHGLNPGNVAAMMRHWLVIEAETADDTGKDAHGMYRITPFGKEFLNGNEEIPRMVYTYKGEVFGYSDEDNPFEDRDEWIRISDIKEFDYRELWLS